MSRPPSSWTRQGAQWRERLLPLTEDLRSQGTMKRRDRAPVPGADLNSWLCVKIRLVEPARRRERRVKRQQVDLAKLPRSAEDLARAMFAHADRERPDNPNRDKR